MEKNISLLLHGNNGSVPDPWFTAYNLTYYQNGQAGLNVVRGRQQQRVLFEAARSINRTCLEALRSRMEELRAGMGEGAVFAPPEVGGPQRMLHVYKEDTQKVWILSPQNKEANTLFEQLLRLFDDDLPTRLATYLSL